MLGMWWLQVGVLKVEGVEDTEKGHTEKGKVGVNVPIGACRRT